MLWKLIRQVAQATKAPAWGSRLFSEKPWKALRHAISAAFLPAGYPNTVTPGKDLIITLGQSFSLNMQRLPTVSSSTAPLSIRYNHAFA